MYRCGTYFNNMKRIEGMHSTHATSTKELDSEAINTTIFAIPATEFALATSGDPSAFKSNEFVEEIIAFGCPQKEWIVLALE